MESPKSSKKMRVEEDRLSYLPDPILHHIFSFLPCTKQIIQSTSTLSKKWTLFWASLPHLHFQIVDHPQYTPGYDVSATNLIGNVLCCRQRDLPLQRLCLSWHFFHNSIFLYLWMAIAIKQNLQEIDIYFEHSIRNVELPDDIFGGSIQVVRLKSYPYTYSYCLPNTMLIAPSLRTLELEKFVLPKPSNEDCGEIVISCPVLETLVLKNCKYECHEVIKLCTDGLKKLEIENQPEDEVCDESNVLFEKFLATSQVLDSQRLLWIEASSDAMTVLEGLQRVESLCLKDIQCFERFPNTLGDLLASYGKLKKLELSISLGNTCSILWLTTLLHRCSLLESFVLEIFKHVLISTVTSKKAFDKVEPVEPVLPLPYTLNHLKYVTIETGVEEINDEFEFLQSLFNNAVNLERMTVTRNAIDPERAPEFHDKLMALFQQFPSV
ncbi:hypothetical protein Sjap_025519 [Stephania japonica]|uniref:F-box/LRR-repeat protein 15/At3g58940/PEG3-like LRR domain-containing protein n=1 Tax=Stephania japonica TaxID=461633 RepID=A0AAP0HE99_9MAGN